MLFEYKTLGGQAAKIELPISKTQFNAAKQNVKGLDLDSVPYEWEFWILRDFLFHTLILKPMQSKIENMLVKVQKGDYNFDLQPTKIKVADVFFHCYSNEIYVFSEPSLVFYGDLSANQLEISLAYDTDELEHILIQLLHSFGVTYVEEDYYNGLNGTELEEKALFLDFILEIWQELKVDTNSTVIGLIAYASGGIGLYDMDKGNQVEELDYEIRDYIKSLGVTL